VSYNCSSSRKAIRLINVCARIVFATLVLGALAAPAAAQVWIPPDPAAEPWTNAKMKIGPIFVAPSFDLRNVGMDNNVFRDDTDPKQDLTATIAVNTKFGVHFKAFSLTFNQDNRYIWFRRYTSERSIDGGLGGVAELRFQTFRPWLKWNKSKTHERAGYEIDERAGRESPEIETGADVNFGLRSGVTVSYRKMETIYDEGEEFDGVNLKQALDNRSTFAHVNGNWAYSAATKLIGGAEWTRTEFLLNPLRSGTALAYFGGFESAADATISGSLKVGYKVQTHDDANVKDFRGAIARATLTTILLDRVKMQVTGDRDINYSYDDDFPYYVEQGGGVSLTIRTSTRLDLLTSARAEWLVYGDTFKLADPPPPSRTDLSTTYGIGFLYRMGGSETGSAFGLTFEQAQRRSPLVGKDFKNGRVLTNIRLSF
jgi:hypothetical protein